MAHGGAGREGGGQAAAAGGRGRWGSREEPEGAQGTQQRVTGTSRAPALEANERCGGAQAGVRERWDWVAAHEMAYIRARPASQQAVRSRGLAGEEGQEGYVAAGLPQSIENGTVGRRQQAVCLLCCGGAVLCRMTPCWQTGIRSSFIHGLACRAARLQRGSSGCEPRQAAQQAGAGPGGARHGPPRRRATVIPP